jgi:hypothetical protein
MSPCLQGWPAKYECDNKCDATRVKCRKACTASDGPERKQCKAQCKNTRNSCMSSCVRCEVCEDANEPSNPEYCQNNVGTYSDKILKCKIDKYAKKCTSSCGLCPDRSSRPPPSPPPSTGKVVLAFEVGSRRQLVEELTLTASGSGSGSDYSDSDISSVQQHVATAAGVDQSLVTIAVTAGSVIITATIAVPASMTADEVQTSLSSTLGTASAASEVLGITVVTVSVTSTPQTSTPQPTAFQVQGKLSLATPAAEHVDSTVTLIGGATPPSSSPAPPPSSSPAPPPPFAVAPSPPPCSSQSDVASKKDTCREECATESKTCKVTKKAKVCKKAKNACKNDCDADANAATLCGLAPAPVCKDNAPTMGFGTTWCETNKESATFCSTSHTGNLCKKTCGLCPPSA